MGRLGDLDDEGLDGGPIETFTDLAIGINALVTQDQILAVVSEVENLLDHLSRLVGRHEDMAREGGQINH